MYSSNQNHLCCHVFQRLHSPHLWQRRKEGNDKYTQKSAKNIQKTNIHELPLVLEIFTEIKLQRCKTYFRKFSPPSQQTKQQHCARRRRKWKKTRKKQKKQKKGKAQQKNPKWVRNRIPEIRGTECTCWHHLARCQCRIDSIWWIYSCHAPEKNFIHDEQKYICKINQGS